MRLGGIVKSSTLDFPGIVSAVLFTQGCNFTCPYCHNPHLVRSFGEPLDEAETLVFLRQRRPLLDGVVISGGEPAIQPDLVEFCKKIRGLGYMVKLDTNGSKPAVLAELIEKKLINYLALDLKADPNNYPPEIGPEGAGLAVMETIGLLKRTGFPHEFRTTAAAPFINAESIVAVARAAAGAGPLYIQQCRLDNVLNPEFMAGHVQPTMNDLKTFYSLT
ncbi:anaerobic ribonucleoside-triphosphate reductase activating protein, partial [Deltaproteobacteria bacterium OttesenSCG-928-K17]|nr:anaerobic ribonucleoside-triphosphate reductase activating protein [Deltaproteobacteria bacterium OttesenSCG-928-K17]